MSRLATNTNLPYDTGEIIDVNNDPNEGYEKPPIEITESTITLEEPKVLLIRELGHFSYNGTEYPYQSLKTTRQSTIIKHRIPKIDGSLNEVLSRPSFTITLEIPAYNLTYKNIYPKALNQLAECLNSKRDYKLFHPTLGNIRANIESISESNDVDHEDGCLITVTFIEAYDFNKEKPFYSDDPDLLIVVNKSFFKERDIVKKILKKRVKNDMILGFVKDTNLISEFTKVLNDVNRGVGSLDRAQRKGIGKVTSILYACDRTINIANSLFSTNAGYISNFLGVIRNIQNQLIKANILNKSNAKAEPITQNYLVPKDMTVASLLKRLNISYETFRKYNNINDNIIKLGTRIIYV